MQFLYISSRDSLNYHPLNMPWNFVIELPTTYRKVKKIALLEFSADNFHEPLYVICDLVKRSFVHDTEQAVLRYISVPGELQNPFYLDTIRENFIRVQFNIVTGNLVNASYLSHVHMVVALDIESD